MTPVSDISAKDVAALRKTTGAGMMDAKRALEETGGDLEAAKQLLLEKGIADPAAYRGTDDDKRQAFVAAFEKLRHRIAAFVSLPFDSLDDSELKRRLAEIGTETE